MQVAVQALIQPVHSADTVGGLLLLCECPGEWNVRGHLASGWLICPFAVGVEQTRGAMVTGRESWVISLGRVLVVVEVKDPVCLPVAWSLVVGGVGWWSHTLFGGARAPQFVCYIDQWVFSLGFCTGKRCGECLVVRCRRPGEFWWFERKLVDSFGRVCFKGELGSVGGRGVRGDEGSVWCFVELARPAHFTLKGTQFPGFKRRPSDFGILSSENTPTEILRRSKTKLEKKKVINTTPKKRHEHCLLRWLADPKNKSRG
jgi:hypothetical protein